jgi:aspartokinase
MYDGYGFLADIFQIFKEEKIDVNIVITSQFEITTTTNEINISKIKRTKEKLSELYQVDIINNCSVVSIISENVLYDKKIDGARSLILENNINPIYISAPSSNNLTWSFVVDNNKSQEIANLLHNYLVVSNC